MNMLIAGGVLWMCVGTPLACGLGSVLRSAAGGDEARWRVLEIADAFLASTARAAEALAAQGAEPPLDRDAAMDAFVVHRHRAAMARVELAASLGESCDAIERSTDVLAGLGELAAAWDDRGGRPQEPLQAGLQRSRAAFARAVWDAVGETGASGRRGTPRMPQSCASPAEP
jgi:hypothetical protein